MKTYRDLLSELQKLSDAQLDSPITVIVSKKNRKNGEACPEYDAIREELSLGISRSGLMETVNGLVDDFLGCMEEEDLVVKMSAPYLILGYDGIPSNEEYQ